MFHQAFEYHFLFLAATYKPEFDLIELFFLSLYHANSTPLGTTLQVIVI